MTLLFNRWVLALMTIPLLLLKFFWVEASERAHENFEPATLATAALDSDVGVSAREFAGITGYKLVPPHNNPDQVRTQGLRVVARSGQSRTLSFLLSTSSPSNDYPSLRVTLSQRDGTHPRIVEFAPNDYGHAKALSSERVELNLEVRDGESRASIEPFYGPAGA